MGWQRKKRTSSAKLKGMLGDVSSDEEVPSSHCGPSPDLRAEPSPDLRDRLMVVLDMDETLIHSQIEVVTTDGTEASAGVHDPRQGEDRAEGQSSRAVHDFEFNIPISQCPGQGEL